jgi:hypothetical protein
MSKLLKYFLLVSALFLAIFVLLVSFNISSQSEMLGSSSIKSRKFYVKKEILPDHSLYPLLMIVDRFRLAMADRERRVYLLMAYAQRRLFYAIRLIEKDELSLALSTLTKSQKYLNEALLSTKSLKETNLYDSSYEELVFFILEESAGYQKSVSEYLEFFAESDRNVLNCLSSETTLLREQLQH